MARHPRALGPWPLASPSGNSVRQWHFFFDTITPCKRNLLAPRHLFFSSVLIPSQCHGILTIIILLILLLVSCPSFWCHFMGYKLRLTALNQLPCSCLLALLCSKSSVTSHRWRKSEAGIAVNAYGDRNYDTKVYNRMCQKKRPYKSRRKRGVFCVM